MSNSEKRIMIARIGALYPGGKFLLRRCCIRLEIATRRRNANRHFRQLGYCSVGMKKRSSRQNDYLPNDFLEGEACPNARNTGQAAKAAPTRKQLVRLYKGGRFLSTA